MNLHGRYLLIIALLIGLIFFFYDRWRASSDIAHERESIINEQNDEIEYRKTKEQRLIADKKAAEITTSELAKAYPKFAEEIKKEFDIKLKYVRAYIRSEFQSHGTGNSVVTNNHYYDSLGNRVDYRDVKVDDGYLVFQARVYDSLNSPYEYTYQDSISTVVSTKKKWLFGSEQLYASSKLSNQNAKVTGMTNVLIKSHRDKRWVISAGVAYNPFDNSFYPAVHAGYALIKF